MPRPKPPVESRAELEKEIMGLLQAHYLPEGKAAAFLIEFFSTFDLVAIRDVLRRKQK